MVTADLTKNPKQEAFFNTVIEAAFGDNDFRYLFYGGAIRGGKTYACLCCLVMLCKIFKGSKWAVIRKNFPSLQETTIPSIEKIIGTGPGVRWSRDKSNYFVEFIKTKSRIYFAGENFPQDQKLDWMLGYEVNGFLLEQVEELQEITFTMCMSRAGTWIIDGMPTPLILATFNPTQTWVKTKVHDVHIEGNLQAPYFYESASPADNPYINEEQWKSWENMPAEYYSKLVGGSWEFAKPPNAFAFAFNEKLHHKDVEFNPNLPLFLSFDFNVEPIVCLFCQHDFDWIHIFKELRLLPSDIFKLSEQIITYFPSAFFMVTGDATGRARQAISRNNKNYYDVIRSELRIGTAQVKVPRANPSVKNTRVLTNALFAKHKNYFINTKACPHLTLDLNGVEVGEHGEIDKKADKRQTHLLDALRYYNWTFHRSFLENSIYQYAAND